MCITFSMNSASRCKSPLQSVGVGVPSELESGWEADTSDSGQAGVHDDSVGVLDEDEEHEDSDAVAGRRRKNIQERRRG